MISFLAVRRSSVSHSLPATAQVTLVLPRFWPPASWYVLRERGSARYSWIRVMEEISMVIRAEQNPTCAQLAVHISLAFLVFVYFPVVAANYVLSTACHKVRISNWVTLKRSTLMAFILSWLYPASINLYLQTCHKREHDLSFRLGAQSQRLINMHIISMMLYVYINCRDVTAAHRLPHLSPEPSLQHGAHYPGSVSRGGEVDSVLFSLYVCPAENTFN